MTKLNHILIRIFFINFSLGLEVDFSTDACLIHLTNFIKLQMDQGRFVGIVLLHLQHVFDTVDHDILRMKFEVFPVISIRLQTASGSMWSPILTCTYFIWGSTGIKSWTPFILR